MLVYVPWGGWRRGEVSVNEYLVHVVLLYMRRSKQLTVLLISCVSLKCRLV